MALYRGISGRTAVAAAGSSATTASNTGTAAADTIWLLIALALVAIGLWIGTALFRALSPQPFNPVDSVGPFAAFYIAAQAIERLLELTGSWIGVVSSGGRLVTKAKAENLRDIAVANGGSEPRAAANAQNVVDRVRANRTVGVWGAASFLALLLCGALGLFLLRAVGMVSAPQWVDLLVTGLVIGGGTKPLHDLISNIAKAKEAREDPEETRSS